MLSSFLIAAAVGNASAPEPQGKWNVDFGKTGCVAMRTYEDDGFNNLFVVKPNVVGERLELAWIATGRPPETSSGTGRVTIGDGSPHEVPALRFGDEQAGQVFTRWFVDDGAALADAVELTIDYDGERHTLPLSGTGKLAEALSNCAEALAAHYNGAGDGIATAASGSADVVTPEDFAALGWKVADRARLSAILLVDEDGSILDCSLGSYEGSARIAGRACAMIRERARYAPARDAAGTAVRSLVLTPMMEWGVDGAQLAKLRRESEAVDRGLMSAKRGNDREGVLLPAPGQRKN